MSERIIPYEDNFKRTTTDLIHEIELIHERERSAAETCNRYRLQVEGLKAQLKQQYDLYQVALKEQADLQRQLKLKVSRENEALNHELALVKWAHNSLFSLILSPDKRVSRAELRRIARDHRGTE